jgi:two-component system, NarL family, nitrate/nitrite response regulator NarL
MKSSLGIAQPLANPTIRILIADRNRMGSQLLAECLDRDSKFQAIAVGPVAQILTEVGIYKPAVIVVSADLDDETNKGLRIARTISAHHPESSLVMLLESSTRESVISAFRCGAKGVFCRNKPLADLRDCIERVSRGEVWASAVETEYLLEAVRNTPSCDGAASSKVSSLSKREVQVAERAAQGYSNRQIADQCKLSEHTVKNYLSRVFEKLGVSNRFELLFLLFKEGNGLSSRAESENIVGLGNPIEIYQKAAEEGYAAAQFIVGLAHLEGYGLQQDDRSAYYWLRMAEENSVSVRQRSSALTGDLKSKIKAGELQCLERRIATGTRNNKLLASHPGDIFRKSVSLITDRPAV